MAAVDTHRSERPRDVQTLVKRCMAVNRPIMIWGPPGIGKSDLIATIAAEQDRPVVDMRLLLCEPTDLRGIPMYDQESKTMKWAQASELPTNTNGLENAILFLDEINAAPPSVQAAAYQLILNRRVGEYVLPAGVSVVCAGNREADKGVTYRMPSPLANRLVHVDMRENFEDWQTWAINNHIHPDVVGFLSHHKQKLYNFDPKSNDRAFATPRTWAFVSSLISDDLPESMNTALVAGTVGEGMAIEFAAHRRVAAKLPKPEDVLRGTVKKLTVKDLSAIYSLTISLCYTLKEWSNLVKAKDSNITATEWNKYFDNFLVFMMDNFQTELVVLGAIVAFSHYSLMVNPNNVPALTRFNQEYGKYILDVGD